MAKKHMRRCSLAPTTGEMQIKAMMRDHHIPIRVAEMECQGCWKEAGSLTVAIGTYGGTATQKRHGSFF